MYGTFLLEFILVCSEAHTMICKSISNGCNSLYSVKLLLFLTISIIYEPICLTCWKPKKTSKIQWT